MLKLMQETVNTRTKSLNKLPEGQKRTDVAGDTAKKQGRVEDLTRKLAQKLQKEESEPKEEGK
jgi:hypothetical protein